MSCLPRPIELFDGAHDVFVEEAGIDLRRADAGMAQLFLNEAKVVTAGLVEMRPVGVAEAVDGEVGAHSGALETSLERLLERPLGDRFAGNRGEDVVLPLHRLAGILLGFQEQQTSLLELQAEMDNASLSPLPHPDNEGGFFGEEIQVADMEGGHFANAQAALKTELDHEPVAKAKEAMNRILDG